MKLAIFSLGLLFFTGIASASVNNQVVIATCKSQDLSHSLRLSRHFLNKEAGLIEITDLTTSRYQRVPAKVTYTNAGARAIFSYGADTPLIITGTGRSQTMFNSQLFFCATNF